MKIMKKIFKSKVFIFVVTAITFSSISVYAAHKYYASDITYKETTLDKALDTLYTTQKSTVNNLNSQITTKDQTISDLQTQVESLTAAASEKDYVTGTFSFPSSGNKDCNLGFRPSKLLLYYTTSSVSAFIYASGANYYWVVAAGSGGGIDYSGDSFEITSTGFRVKNIANSWHESNKTFNYVAFK